MTDAHKEIFNAEPPVEDKPVETPVTPEPTPEPEPPAEPTEVVPEVEPAKPETPPEAKTVPDEGFYQDAYQKAKELAKKHSPALHDQIYDELKADRKPQTPEPVTPPDPATPPEAEGDADPYLAAIQKTMRETVKEEIPRVLRQERAQEAYEQEMNAADALAAQFCTDNKIEKQAFLVERDKAASTINMNQLGGPTAVLELIIERFQGKAMREHYAQNTATAQAEGEAKALAAAQVAQPKPGALPEPTELPEWKQQLKDMEDAEGSSDANKEVFG